MKTTCIICPMGCELEINEKDGSFFVSGNNCMRGEVYGKSEMTKPVRVVTSVIYGENQIVSVKTDKPIDKNKIQDLLNLLNQAPKKLYQVGDIVFENPLGLDCNVVVTNVEDI